MIQTGMDGARNLPACYTDSFNKTSTAGTAETISHYYHIWTCVVVGRLFGQSLYSFHPQIPFHAHHLHLIAEQLG